MSRCREQSSGTTVVYVTDFREVVELWLLFMALNKLPIDLDSIMSNISILEKSTEHYRIKTSHIKQNLIQMNNNMFLPLIASKSLVY